MAGPDDGYAYTPIELEGIWQIPVALSDISESYQPAYEFHTHCAALESLAFEKKAHEDAILLITRAIIAEAIDNPPKHVMPPDLPVEDERLMREAFKAHMERYRVTHEQPTPKDPWPEI